jgi:hypothetical protein
MACSGANLTLLTTSPAFFPVLLAALPHLARYKLSVLESNRQDDLLLPQDPNKIATVAWTIKYVAGI